MRRNPRVGAMVLAAAFLLGIFGMALAHATLVGSDPAAGAVLSSSPSRIRLVFSEPIVGDMSRISLVDRNGVSTSLPTTVDPRDVHALVAPAPTLSEGPYRVAWRIVSADGHPIDGSYVFHVVMPSAAGRVEPQPVDSVPAAPTTSSPGPTIAGAAAQPAIFRGMAVMALLALTGLLGHAVFADPAALGTRARSFLNFLAVTSPLLLLIQLASWLAYVSSSDANSLEQALTSAVARPELLRVMLSLLATWALLLARRLGLAFAFALAAVAAGGAIGHSAAVSPVVAVPAKTIHLLAGAAWLGSLLWLMLFASSGSAEFLRQARRVSSVALAAVIAVSASGVVQSVVLLARPSDLTQSAYGRFVIAKVAGLGLLLLFGAYNRYRLIPSVSRNEGAPALRRSAFGEAAVMLIVILIAGIMSYVPTPETTDARSPIAVAQP